MATLYDDLRPDIDDIRGIAAELGGRRFTVSLVTRTWTGERVGVGTKTDVTTTIKVAHGTLDPAVAQVSTREIIASGDRFTDQDLKVGPLTPAYPGGGVADATAVPALAGLPTEIFWKVTGPGIPPGGAWFDQIWDDTGANLHTYLYLRANGKIP